MFERYMSVVRLLDGIGPWGDRLKDVHRIVRAPDFLYLESPSAMYLLAILVHSSYWLDTELFDENVIQKDPGDKALIGEQRSHVLLLDIGSTLMDKGFPLNQEMVNTFCSKSSPIYPYAKTFLSQCQKRNDWLKNMKVISRKQIPLGTVLKEKEMLK